MTRSKTNSSSGGGTATKPPPNRNSSSTSLSAGKTAKATESNVVNNNVVTETPPPKAPATDRVESAKSERVKSTTPTPPATDASQSRAANMPSPIIPTSLKTGLNFLLDPSQASIVGNSTQENGESKGSSNNASGLEQQQRTITFFDQPLGSSTSVTSKSASSKPKSADSNQQAQKQVKLNVIINAPANKTQDVNANKPSGSSPSTNVTSNAQPAKPPAKSFPVPQSRYTNNISRSMVSLERSRNFRAFIEKAMNDHKIFACCGVYPAIRNALKKRGWIEKPGPLAYSRSANTTVGQATKAEDESDVAWMTRVLKDHPADFIWVIRRDNIDWKNMTKDQLINRFPKAWFTTKVGIAACLQHMHWFSEAGVSDTFFPRCYRLCLEEERLAFQDDYRLTACMSYLRYFVDTFETKGHSSLADVHSKITPLSVDFAARQLGNYIRMRRHEDIDWLLPPNFMTQHWDAFIHQYYAVVHEKKRLRFDSPEAVHVKYETAKKMLHKVAQYWPQIQLDGVYNMWICKPGARSRGKGIVIMNNVEKILDLLTQSNFRECNWVVQKYIERPMLIYKTKFDIRQWFLITDWTPLTVWFYKESYVRFCTKPFNLEDFHESIHLCNNAIQCRYQNSDQRDSNLPDENMWSSDTFQAYLKTIGRLDAWPLVYSGMKQAIVGVLLASQETVESKKGCYELYGADFMLTEDFRPWLIEINSCPCMAASTSVTARMCSQCLEDTVKVVVDRRHNKNADTGLFEMIYRQNSGSVLVQQFSGHDLTIVGKKLNRDIEWPMAMSKSVTNTMRSKGQSQANLSKSKSENNKQTLSELLQKLRVRNQEMFQGTLASQQSQIDSIFDSSSPVITVGKTDTTTLIEKMRALKTTVASEKEVKDVLSSAKRIYPSPDPTKMSPEDFDGFEANNNRSFFDKDLNPGKGDLLQMPSKYADMNSIAYLMKNSQNSSGLIGELLKASKETAQELIIRTRKQEAAKKQSTITTEEPAPKTLADVKAMVESAAIGRPPKEKEKQQSESDKDKNGKSPRTTASKTSSIFTQNNYTSNNTQNTSSHESESYVNFHLNSKQKIASCAADKSDDTTEFVGESEPQESLTKADPGASHYFSDDINNVSEKRAGGNNLEAPISPSVGNRKILQGVGRKDGDRDLHNATSTKTEEIGANFNLGTAKSLSKSLRHCSNEEPSLCDDNNCDINSRHGKNNNQNPLNASDDEYIATPSTSKIRDDDDRKQVESQSHKTKYYNHVYERLQSSKNPEQSTSATKNIKFLTNSTSTDEVSMGESDSYFNNAMYGPALLNSTTSQSSSDSDSDFNNNEVTQLSSNFIPLDMPSEPDHFEVKDDSSAATTTTTITQHVSPSSSTTTATKLKPIRYQRRTTSTGSRRCCSKRYPCYRVILEPQNYQQQRYVLNNKRKSGPTLPMKTVNLLLPSNYTFY